MTTTDARRDSEVASDALNALFAAQGFAQPKIFAEGLRKDADGWAHNAWEIRIEGELFAYHTGTGIKGQPNPAEVLACYCREGLEANEPFADWCATFGYDKDSRKALATYLVCQANGEKARRVLGSRKLVEQFAELSYRL